LDKTIDILVVGDINVDLILIVDKLPKRGGMQYVEKIVKTHGGVGGNISTALSKLGLKTLLIGAIGDDNSGLETIEELRQNKVDASRVKIISGAPTGLMIVIVDREGERTMIGYRGANSELTIDEDDIHILERSKHLHVSGYVFLNKDSGEGSIRLLTYARSIGITTSIDIEGVAIHKKTVLENLKGLFNYVIAGEEEARQFTSEDKQYRLADELLRKLQAEIAVVKLGARGCMVAYSNGSFHIPAFHVRVLDTTGAGDAFNAGFLYGLIKNLPLREAVILGNAIGAYKCMGIGARHLPTLRDLENTFPELKDRVTLT
jgi:ribokinase